jgi:hypothetical protein
VLGIRQGGGTIGRIRLKFISLKPPLQLRPSLVIRTKVKSSFLCTVDDGNASLVIDRETRIPVHVGPLTLAGSGLAKVDFRPLPADRSALRRLLGTKTRTAVLTLIAAPMGTMTEGGSVKEILRVQW